MTVRAILDAVVWVNVWLRLTLKCWFFVGFFEPKTSQVPQKEFVANFAHNKELQRESTFLDSSVFFREKQLSRYSFPVMTLPLLTLQTSLIRGIWMNVEGGKKCKVESILVKQNIREEMEKQIIPLPPSLSCPVVSRDTFSELTETDSACREHSSYLTHSLWIASCWPWSAFRLASVMQIIGMLPVIKDSIICVRLLAEIIIVSRQF